MPWVIRFVPWVVRFVPRVLVAWCCTEVPGAFLASAPSAGKWRRVKRMQRDFCHGPALAGCQGVPTAAAFGAVSGGIAPGASEEGVVVSPLQPRRGGCPVLPEACRGQEPAAARAALRGSPGRLSLLLALRTLQRVADRHQPHKTWPSPPPCVFNEVCWRRGSVPPRRGCCQLLPRRLLSVPAIYSNPLQPHGLSLLSEHLLRSHPQSSLLWSFFLGGGGGQSVGCRWC